MLNPRDGEIAKKIREYNYKKGVENITLTSITYSMTPSDY